MCRERICKIGWWCFVENNNLVGAVLLANTSCEKNASLRYTAGGEATSKQGLSC